MSAPSDADPERLLVDHAALWNAERFDEWKELWLAAAPSGMTAEGPIGAPLRVGWDECWGRTLEAYADWLILPQHTIVCGREAVLVVTNRSRADASLEFTSVEHYQVSAEGHLAMRFFW